MVRHLLVISVLSLAACGGKSAPPPVQNAAPAEPVAAAKPTPKTEMEAAMARMHEYSARMCACLDKTCADAVQGDMTRWSEEMSKRDTKAEPLKPTDAEMKRMTQIATTYAECMTKLMTATP